LAKLPVLLEKRLDVSADEFLVLKGSSIAKKQTFRLSDPDFRGWKLLLPTAIHF
jgi:hypothetical protein